MKESVFRMKKIVFFSYIFCFFWLVALATGIYYVYLGIIENHSGKLIVGALLCVLFPVVINITWGYMVIDKKHIKQKDTFFGRKYSITPIESIKCVYIRLERWMKSTKVRQVTITRANSSTGEILAVGTSQMHALIHKLDVPVYLEYVGIFLLPNVRILLKKGKLSLPVANSLKKYFHTPQKLFDKWYVEPKQ